MQKEKNTAGVLLTEQLHLDQASLKHSTTGTCQTDDVNYIWNIGSLGLKSYHMHKQNVGMMLDGTAAGSVNI